MLDLSCCGSKGGHIGPVNGLCNAIQSFLKTIAGYIGSFEGLYNPM